MATKQELRTFKQIVDQIMGLMKYQSTDNLSREKIKADVQRAYLTEVMPLSQWPWLRGKVTLQAEAYFATGTAAVTQNSVTVTLTETLITSRKGYYFSVDGQSERYLIKSHSAGSTTLTLDMPYVSQTSSAIKFKIWTDSLPLPAEVTDIIQVTSNNFSRPLQGFGIQDIRRLDVASPKAEGKASSFTLGDWIDPDPYSSISGMPASLSRSSSQLVKSITFASSLGSTASTMLLQVGDRIEISGAGQYDYNIEAIVSSVTTTNLLNDTIVYSGLNIRSEALTSDTGITVKKQNSESYERQRQLIVWPAISSTPTNLFVDYIKEAAPLVDDSDEPSLPLSDRIVLFWLGLFYSYSRERNPDEALIYRQMADNRLARMAGNTNESKDKPSFLPSQLYINSKRHQKKTRSLWGDTTGFGSGSSSTNPLGTPNQVAVFGSDGTLQSDPLISMTELESLNNIQGNIEARLNALGLPSGSAGGRVLVTDLSDPPAIIESDVTTEELEALVGSSGFATTTIDDNTASPLAIFSVDQTEYDALDIEYKINRDGEIEKGRITLVHNGSTSALAQGGIASTGATGVELFSDLSGGSLSLTYTSDSRGVAGTITYKVSRWPA